MQTVLSGIRSTGHLHLGNYFGALRNFVKIQDDYNCFYFIADLHSLTTHPHPDDFHANVRTILAEYLAAGLDPDKVTIFVQSDVPEVSELYVLLNMIAYKGELERTTTFKDKVRLAKAKARNLRLEDISYDDHNDEGINISAGLLTYPVLMAADILIHRADFVPVGKDQEQHLEYARVMARRFNNMYGEEVFTEPRAFNFGGGLIKVPGLRRAQQPHAGVYREPVYPYGACVRAVHRRVFQGEVERLLDPLRRPQEAACRGHLQGDPADT